MSDYQKIAASLSVKQQDAMIALLDVENIDGRTERGLKSRGLTGAFTGYLMGREARSVAYCCKLLAWKREPRKIAAAKEAAQCAKRRGAEMQQWGEYIERLIEEAER